jgi:hypothetical protein
MKEVLLHHYYILTKRKSLCCSVREFWEMGTFETYTLLNWEKEQMEIERKEMEKNKKGGGSSNTEHERVENEKGVDFFNKLTGRKDGGD